LATPRFDNRPTRALLIASQAKPLAPATIIPYAHYNLWRGYPSTTDPSRPHLINFQLLASSFPLYQIFFNFLQQVHPKKAKSAKIT
jgi:hypothetical protein